MKFLPEILVSIVLFVYILTYGSVGRSTKSIFVEDNLLLEKQFNSLRKPAIHSYKKNGDIIDCIDIYRQPAFDHSLLKNHTLQLRPRALPKGLRSGKGVSISSEVEIEGCPSGTVPFRRLYKKDLLAAKQVLSFKRRQSVSQSSNLPPNIHYAAVTTPLDGSQTFCGAKTSISVYNLSLEVSAPQISESFLWIGTGSDGPYNSIEYGWTVNPQLYGDSQTRTYSLWTADGFQNTGCYDAVCEGYVQVSQKRIMGEVNNPVSTFGGDVYAMEFSILKDPKTGNWWLYENLGDTQNEAVGYWPKELFPSMGDSAKVVQMGGKIYNPTSSRVPMGSGAFIPDDFTRTCYASNIQFVNSGNQFYDPNDVPMQVTADNQNMYKAVYKLYMGDVSKDHPGRGSLLFGGPNIEI